MGELEEALALQPESYLIEDPLFSPPFIAPLLSNPSPTSICKECWNLAEDTAENIIRLIQPTVESEKKRRCVIQHVQNLLSDCVPGSEVFPFGSVPLKTYLPDGDIDLTALSVQGVEDSLANDVRTVLEREEHNKDTDFEVKDVQYINAEVKLIKCLVQNIVVDVSFNQLGGLCTLCFLEQVDRLIGKNHLFKRSIILIKAWCYHESRILGAHHGLISTYALETMVLYIFHLFHSSLNGPLAVLYRFLDYYSKFDWDNFCISLYGPVRLSSLPEIVAETPDNEGGELLLDKEFLRNCVDMFSVPSRGPDPSPRSFPQKHFNIIDPLKENNNLGRSVSKGNFYRIRSAFTYGARKLGQILLLTVDDIVDELNKFFTNTLERHGSRQRPDVRVFMPVKSVHGSDHESSEAATDKCTGDKTLLDQESSKSATDKCTGDKTLLDSSAFSLSGTEESGSSSQGSLGSLEAPDSLSDLSGDYDDHINSLACAQWCYDCSFSGPFLQGPPMHTQYHNQQVFDTPHGPIQYFPNAYPQINANGVFPGLHPFQVHPPSVSGVGYCVEEVSRPRGTGTYLPNPNGYRERTTPGRTSAPPVPRGQFVRAVRDNNWAGTPEMHFTGKGRRAPRHDRFQSNSGQAKPGQPGFFQDSYFMPRESSHMNGFYTPFEQLEFGSLGQQPSRIILEEASWQVPSAHTEEYSSHFPAMPTTAAAAATTTTTTTTTTSPRPVSGVNDEGGKSKGYHLKKESSLSKLKGYHLTNEADFPPLSVPVAK